MMMRFKRILAGNFAAKVTAAFLAVFMVIFFMTGLLISRRLSAETLEKIKSRMRVEARLVAQSLQSRIMDGTDPQVIQELVGRLAATTDSRITLIDHDGKVLADSSVPWEDLSYIDNHASRPEVKEAFAGRVGFADRNSFTVKKRMAYLALPLFEENPAAGIVRVALPLKNMAEAVSSVSRPIIFSTGLGILAVLLLGFWIGRSISLRLRVITEAARRYGRGDFIGPIHLEADDEFKLVTHAMNHMASSLRKRIAEREAETAKVAAILANMSEGVIAVDAAKKVLAINASGAKIFSVEPENVAGKGLLEVVKNDKIDAMIEKVLAERSRVSEEIELIHPGGRILQASAVSMAGGDGDVSGGILVFHDVTGIRRLERVRQEFAANVSHELYTPLTSIKGFVETLLDGALEDRGKAVSFLTIIQEDTLRLTRLIEDILELAKFDSAAYQLKPEFLDFTEALRMTLEGLQHKIRQKGVTVMTLFNEAKPIMIWADPDRLRQILLNLLDNAVKFNRSGGEIFIDVRVTETEARMSIRDGGIGIPKELVPEIFKRFFRVDKGRSRELGGTGLGLAIVKHIVEAHEGKITCESESGKGSTFTVTLPFPAQI